jgi:glycosyltransferase involved in cell wall biosynthesis
MAVAEAPAKPAGAAARCRVLHTYKIYKPEADGGIPAVISILTAMADPGLEHEILTARKRGWFRRLADGKTPVIAVSSLGDISSLPVAPSFPFWVRARASRNDILVHHVPFPLTDLAITAFGLPKSTALVVHWHGDIDGRPLLKRLLAPIFHRSLARADAVIVSDEIMIANSPFLRRVAAKCVVIPYGIDTAFWRTLDDAARARVAALRETYPRLIVALGRLVPYKGYDVLLRAMARIDGAHLMIIGDGPLRQELSDLARDLKITDRVDFAGRLPRNEAKIVVHAAKVFVMPSKTIGEAFGLAQVEAMATGRPVVNTDLPTTVPRVARHNREGLTVPPNDDVALAGALQTLLDDRSLAERLGAAGQARAADEYDQTVFVRRVESLYRRLAQSRCSLP